MSSYRIYNKCYKIYNKEKEMSKGQKVQVLVAAMNQTDHSLLKKMNIKTDTIVGNQCKRNCIERFRYNGHDILYLNFNEKGVGLNRNNALMRATGDICLFADDDMVYVDDYDKIVKSVFEKYFDADVIIFNLKESKQTRYIIRKVERVWYLNYLRYGTARIAVKLSKLRKNSIYFNQSFGGGTEHCHGEDSIFLTECLKAGLKIYAVPITIAELTEERKSTWNAGYNKKYLQDQGALYKTISRRGWKLLCLQDALRRSRREYGMSLIKAYKIMIASGKNI